MASIIPISCKSGVVIFGTAHVYGEQWSADLQIENDRLKHFEMTADANSLTWAGTITRFTTGTGGITATKLAIGAFITPYIFVFNPSMLWIDTTWYGLIQTLVTSIGGMTFIGAAMIGFFFAPMKWWERFAFFIIGLLLVDPGTLTDIIGIVIGGILILYQWRQKKAGVLSTATAMDA